MCNRPNVTDMRNVPEGLIIENGQALYRSSGYADAFDRKVKTIEFSMDHGETWTTRTTSGTADPANSWIWWNVRVDLHA